METGDQLIGNLESYKNFRIICICNEENGQKLIKKNEKRKLN